jgi:hypothetical protein
MGQAPSSDGAGMPDGTGRARVRGRRAVALGAALAATAALSAVGVSIADTQRDDGDLGGSPGPNLFYGAGAKDHACTTMGTAVSGAVTLSYGGGSHFTAGAPVTLAITRDAATVLAGISVTQTGSTVIPSTWAASSADVDVPFTTTVPAGTPDGNYKVEVVAATGAFSASGKHTYVIHVHCTGPAPANGAPSVTEVSGASTVAEGSDHGYGVTATDPDEDGLTYAWSVLSGNALIPDDATAQDVSVHFSDGPSTVVLQVVVDDGNGNTVTKTKTIDETNVAPTATITSGDTSVNESSVTTHNYTYTITDPGNDDQTPAISCGALGTVSNPIGTNAGGSFDCTFPDGLNPTVATTTSDVTAQATDSDSAVGNTATRTVTVNNVAPSVGGLTLAGNSGTACLAGKVVTLDFGFSDPGLNDAPWAVDVDWGVGQTHTTYNAATQGAQTQRSNLYIGAGSWTVGATVTDKDGGVGSSPAGAGATFALRYSSGAGILQPINYTGARSAFKIGSTIPVKIKITDCAGNPVSGLQPQVALKFLDAAPDGTVVEDVISTVPDQGTTMRYTGSPDYQYIYNLATKGKAVGDYTVTISDATIAPVAATVSMKK